MKGVPHKLEQDYPWAAGDSMGRELQRLDQGVGIEADKWQGMTQGWEGRINWGVFWREFDSWWRDLGCWVWKRHDPWTIMNRRRNRRARCRRRL